MVSLQKLRQYNKNLRNHQTKLKKQYKLIKITKELELYNPRKYNLLKRINSKSYIKWSLFRSNSSEVFSKKGALKTRSKTTGEQQCRSANSTHLLSNFIEITHTHGYAPKNLQHIRIRRTPSSRRIPLGNCFCMSKEL